MYAKRVAEAVELAKARAGAIMVRKAAESRRAAHRSEPAARELAAAECGEKRRADG
jgi:hypothetical protein